MKTLIIACLAALATVVCAQDKQAAATPIFSDAIIQSWDYRTLKTESREQSGWEAKHFGKATIRLQSIKGTKEISGAKNTYYRFRIAEETFATPVEAKRRVERIRDTPPGLDTKMDPHWVLCDGVAVGRIAYIVSTDSVKFEMEALPSVIKLLSTQVASK
jgi:hypothetical protein